MDKDQWDDYKTKQFDGGAKERHVYVNDQTQQKIVQTKHKYKDSDNVTYAFEYRNGKNQYVSVELSPFTVDQLVMQKQFDPNFVFTKTGMFTSVSGGVKKEAVSRLGNTREEQSDALAKMFGNDFRAPQAYGLTKRNVVNLREYMITKKVDGEHQFIKYGTSVFDTEQYNDKYFVFDVLYLNGESMLQETFEKRYKALQKFEFPRNCLLKKFWKVEFEGEQLQYIIETIDGMKTMQTAEAILHDGSPKTFIQTDGVIFTEIDRPYCKTLNWKLKETRNITNDYLLQYDSQKKQYNLKTRGFYDKDFQACNAIHYDKIDGGGLLFDFHIPYVKCGNFSHIMKLEKTDINYLLATYENYDKDVFNQAMQGNLDGQIVEVAYDKNMKSYPIRVRVDKENPNNFQTCLDNYQNCLDDFHQPMGYFKIAKQDKNPAFNDFRWYGNQSRLISYQTAVQNVKTRGTILDIGSGNGVNLHLIVKDGFKRIIGLDIDIAGWITFYERLREICSVKQQKCKIPFTYLVNYESLPFVDWKCDLILSNYTLHYQMLNFVKVKQIIQIIQDRLKSGGVFYFLNLDGKRVFDILKKNKGLYENEKYHIEAQYKEDTFQDYGQEIKIILPTISDDPYIEALVNNEYLGKQLGNDFQQVDDMKMTEYIKVKEFSKIDLEYAELTNAYFYVRK